MPGLHRQTIRSPDSIGQQSTQVTPKYPSQFHSPLHIPYLTSWFPAAYRCGGSMGGQAGWEPFGADAERQQVFTHSTLWTYVDHILVSELRAAAQAFESRLGHSCPQCLGQLSALAQHRTHDNMRRCVGCTLASTQLCVKHVSFNEIPHFSIRHLRRCDEKNQEQEGRGGGGGAQAQAKPPRGRGVCVCFVSREGGHRQTWSAWRSS